jgi:hypothetical protein
VGSGVQGRCVYRFGWPRKVFVAPNHRDRCMWVGMIEFFVRPNDQDICMRV